MTWFSVSTFTKDVSKQRRSHVVTSAKVTASQTEEESFKTLFCLCKEDWFSHQLSMQVRPESKDLPVIKMI